MACVIIMRLIELETKVFNVVKNDLSCYFSKQIINNSGADKNGLFSCFAGLYSGSDQGEKRIFI